MPAPPGKWGNALPRARSARRRMRAKDAVFTPPERIEVEPRAEATKPAQRPSERSTARYRRKEGDLVTVPDRVFPVYVGQVDGHQDVGGQGATCADPAPDVDCLHAGLGLDGRVRAAEFFPKARKETYRDHVEALLARLYGGG